MAKTDDLTDFLPLFLAECREHLAVLVATELRLAHAPGDRDAAAAAARVARTVAGMADTMGFPRTASLGRALEAAVGHVAGAFGPDALAALEGCREALAGSLAAIAEGGRERLEPAALIARLASLVRAPVPAQPEHVTAAAEPVHASPAARADEGERSVAALLVEAGGAPLGLPLDRVERALSLDREVVRSVVGGRVLVLRGESLPLLDLAGTVGYAPSGSARRAVVVRAGGRSVAVAVDRLVGQRELAARPLPAATHGAALSAAAVLEDGRIALLVDCDALAGGVRSATNDDLQPPAPRGDAGAPPLELAALAH